MRVVVVGAGVVGLCTAHSLRATGAEVTVVDAGPVGQGASWANAGWIVPSLSGPIPDRGVLSYVARSVVSPGAPVYLRPHYEPGLLTWLWHFARSCTRRRHLEGLHATARLARRTMELFDELRAGGVGFDMWHQGIMFVGLTTGRVEEELGRLRVVGDYGYRLPSVITTGAELRDAEPALLSDVAAGFVIAEERHVDPASLVHGLAAALRRSGVELHEGTPVTGFDRRGDRIDAVRTAAGTMAADRVVLAAGAWSGRLARGLGVRLPLQPGRGYSFSASLDNPPTRPLYLLEAKTGVSPLGSRVRVAGTMELSGLKPGLDRSRLDAMHRASAGYVAGLDAADPSEPWSGMRPLTPDGLPVIGRAPATSNAYLATGHGMLGVTLGPATGKAVADLIVRNEDPPWLRPFDPARFADRRLPVTTSAQPSYANRH